jgi:hypothetical protein
MRGQSSLLIGRRSQPAGKDVEMTGGRIVAVGLLTQEHLDMLGTSLQMVYRIDETPCFAELLEAIDQADREHWREEDRKEILMRLRQTGPT